MNKQIADIDPIEIDFDTESFMGTTAVEPAAPVVPADIAPDPIIPAIEPAVAPAAPAAAPIIPAAEELEETSVISEIVNGLGYEEFINASEFEDSPAGIIELAKAAGDRMATDTLDKLFAAHPTLQAHLEYVQNGGDPRDFFRSYTEEVDYTGITLDEKNPEVLKYVLKDYFTKRGDDPAFHEDMIEAYMDKGQLFSKATAALNALAGVQVKQRDNLIASQRAIAAKEAADSLDTWNKVDKIITTAPDLAGIPIAVSERSKFKDYISKPVDAHGRTQRDLDLVNAPLDTQLALDFLLYKKLDMSKFIAKKAATQTALSLKERLDATAKLKGAAPGRSTNTKDAASEIDLDAI